jgi:hypothetical protein
LIVTALLQTYADRGVFLGFKAARRPGGRHRYTFTWLMRRPFTLDYDPARRVLAFPTLFPRVSARSPMAAALRAVVGARSTRRVAAHKRLDGRKVRTTCGVQRGSFALRMRVHDGEEAYAVSHLLNLVNELFLTLQERFPDYLVAEFGLSAE